MTRTLITQAVFDEAGETGRHIRSSRYLVVAGMICNDLVTLRRAIIRIHKGLSKRLINIPELKAYHTPAAVTTKLLNRLAAEDIHVYATIIDKHLIPPSDSLEDWYAYAYVTCMKQVLADHDSVSFSLDARYTNRHRQQRFVNALLASTQQSGQSLAITFADSAKEQAIQAADFVAWSFFRKYEMEDSSFCEILKDKIVAEVTLP
ncbi:MAG: DUF3800 domain-containing protein [Chloroflexi bacterium]|nr:DUF3800 domain-containing protein [Chloroflexota bacterium]